MKVDNNERFSYVPFAADDWQVATQTDFRAVNQFNDAMHTPDGPSVSLSLLTPWEAKGLPHPEQSVMDWAINKTLQRQHHESELAMEVKSLISAVQGGEAYKSALTPAQFREQQLNAADPGTTQALEARLTLTQALAAQYPDFEIFNEAMVVNSAAPVGMGVEQARVEMDKLDRAIVHAAFSADVYDDYGDGSRLPVGFRRMDAVELDLRGFRESDLNDVRTGYFGAIYINDDTRRIVVANRGTEGLFNKEDMGTNLLHPFMGSVGQYESARDLARLINNEFGKDYKIEFTGHSLGGNLAAYQALLTGLDAITFNAAGLSPATRQELAQGRDGVSRLEFEEQQISAFTSTVIHSPFCRIVALLMPASHWLLTRARGRYLAQSCDGGKDIPVDQEVIVAARSVGVSFIEDYIPNAAGQRHELTAVGLNDQPWYWSDKVRDQIHLLAHGDEADSDTVWIGSAAFELHSIAAVIRALHYDLGQLQRL